MDSNPSSATADTRAVEYAHYGFASDAPSHTHRYLWKSVLDRLSTSLPSGRVLDAGCGNGAFCAELHKHGKWEVSGIDLSESGIEIARKRHSGIRFERMSVSDDIIGTFGRPFDAIVSLEVIEHLYSPSHFVEALHQALVPRGTVIMSTPYHGYLKNLLLAGTGKLDSHFTALWEGGHIKFWSRTTLTKLLTKHGFDVVHFDGCGRFPYLWKSMVLTAVRRD